MSFDTEPERGNQEEDIRTFYGITDALRPLSDYLHETIGTIGCCAVVAEMAVKRLQDAEAERDHLKRLLREAVPTIDHMWTMRLKYGLETISEDTADLIRRIEEATK